MAPPAFAKLSMNVESTRSIVPKVSIAPPDKATFESKVVYEMEHWELSSTNTAPPLAASLSSKVDASIFSFALASSLAIAPP